MALVRSTAREGAFGRGTFRPVSAACWSEHYTREPVPASACAAFHQLLVNAELVKGRNSDQVGRIVKNSDPGLALVDAGNFFEHVGCDFIAARATMPTSTKVQAASLPVAILCRPPSDQWT